MIINHTGISSEIRTKLPDWVIWQARAGCYSQAALSSNDSKTLYTLIMDLFFMVWGSNSDEVEQIHLFRLYPPVA